MSGQHRPLCHLIVAFNFTRILRRFSALYNIPLTVSSARILLFAAEQEQGITAHQVVRELRISGALSCSGIRQLVDTGLMSATGSRYIVTLAGLSALQRIEDMLSSLIS